VGTSTRKNEYLAMNNLGVVAPLPTSSAEIIPPDKKGDKKSHQASGEEREAEGKHPVKGIALYDSPAFEKQFLAINAGT